MVAPCPPCTAIWAVREVEARGGGARGLCVAVGGHAAGRRGDGSSRVGGAGGVGAHGGQRGEPEHPLLQEQQPSLQPQPQSQQLFDNHAQLSPAVHTSQANAEEGDMKVAQQKDNSMLLQQQHYSEACTGLERTIVLQKAEFSRLCANNGTTGSSFVYME